MGKIKNAVTSTITFGIEYDHGYGCFQDALLALRKAQKVYPIVQNYTVNCKTEIEVLSSKEGIEEEEYSKREYGDAIQSVIYNNVRKDERVAIFLSNSVNEAVHCAIKCYDKHKRDVNCNRRTRESYKSPQPIPIPSQNLKIYEDNGVFYLRYQPFSRDYNKQSGFPAYEAIHFKIKRPSKINADIIRKCISPDYCDFKFRASKIKRGKKGKWYLLLTCHIPVESLENKGVYLDKGKYLGVDLGVVNALYASIYGDKEKNALPISGEHMVGYVHKMKKRLSEMQRSISYCGKGKIGHGTTKRFEAVTKLRGKIANYRDTENKKMARQVIDYAIKNSCGTIQMEDLSGIKSNKKGKFLGDWVYYNLQLAIEHSAKKVGIDVVYVKPRYTSQRCSKCGAIHKENRKSQSEFVCVECGFTANADFNASQNLAIPFIDKIIEEVKPSKKYKKVG